MLEVIQDLRRQIDALDDEILELLARRISLANQIGEIKKHCKQEIKDKKREEEILRRLGLQNKLTRGQIDLIYEAIFALTQQIQEEK